MRNKIKFWYKGILSLLSVIFVCAFATTVSAQSSQNTVSKSFGEGGNIKSPIGGQFPIVASGVFNPSLGPDKRSIAEVEKCGFNLCMDVSSSDAIVRLLDAMDGTNLKLLAGNYNAFNVNAKVGDWREEIQNFVKRIGSHAKLAGWKFGDEPSWNQLAQYQERYDFLKSLSPSHFISFNLVGEIIKSHTGPCKSLEVYLDSISEKFKLDVLSSDFYPIKKINGKLIVDYQGFYSDLDAFSRKAKQIGLPMWAYCESMAYTTSSFSRPEATVPYLSFEAFSALAYGAQGLVYWTYWQRPSAQVEKYLSALVDLNGNKTKAWYAAQTVNAQIRALTPVFLGAEMMECRHTGNVELRGTYSSIESFGPVRSMTFGKKGVLVSHLRNKGNDYLLIVNHDVEKKQKIQLIFNGDYSVSQISVSNSGEMVSVDVPSQQKVTLPAGGYALYSWR